MSSRLFILAMSGEFPLGVLDILVIAAYLVSLLVIGLRSMRHIHVQEDYFLGGRRFGKFVSMFAAFGQATSAESAVGMTTLVQVNGASGIWSTLAGGLLFMPVFWMTSVWYRRMRMLTLADFFVERYGSVPMAGFYSAFQAVFFMIVAALGFAAMGKTVAAIAAKPVSQLSAAERSEYESALELGQLERTDFNSLSAEQTTRLHQLRLQGDRKEFTYLDEQLVMWSVAIVVLLYSVTGGLEAAFISEVIQSSFIIVLSGVLIPFAMLKINAAYGGEGLLGPFEVMHRVLPEWFFEIWGSPNVIDFTWHWIAVMGLLGMLNVAVQANQMVICGSAKDEMSARFGMTVGIFIKRTLTIIWGLVAMFTVVLYGSSIKNPDYIWGHATRDLLGPVGLGLIGLMIACMCAALMSTLSALMITTSGLITHNLYRVLIPHRPDAHYLLVGRIVSVIFLVGSVLIANQYSNVFSLMKLVWVFNCAIAASFWLGILWRKANATGAWCSIILTTLFTLVLPTVLPMVPGMRTNEYLMKMTIPAPVSKVYTASETDVAERGKEIASFDAAAANGTEHPKPLVVGQQFTQTFALPRKSIFWEGDIMLVDGRPTGRGMLKVELVLFDLLGLRLEKNSYSLNETILLLTRLLVPFGTLYVVSLFTASDDRSLLNKFFAKMRTPIQLDSIEDRHAVEQAAQNPESSKCVKLFPNSNWEFRKWERSDFAGVLASCVGVFACVGFLWFVVNVGG